MSLRTQEGSCLSFVGGFLGVKITICQLGGMFEIENKMVGVKSTSILYCSIPDYVSKCKLLQPAHLSCIDPEEKRSRGICFILVSY